jgi:CarD family transcriptional regulator
MNLSVGEKIIFPSHGPCLIGAVVDKLVGGMSTSFYRLAPLENISGELFVPVDKMKALGIRQLMNRSEIPKLLGHLKCETVKAKNWKQRAIDNTRLLASGSAFDLAEIVESLTELNETKTLAPHDRQTLERAKKLLICEIAEVLGENKSAAEERIDKALQRRKQSEPAA